MTLLLTIASLFAAAIPMLFFLWLVWSFDLYDREPVWLIGGAFLWGALGGVLIAIVLQIPIDLVLSMIIDDRKLVMQVAAAVVAPLTEEPGKALILFLMVRSRHFDNMSDGFVFGAAAGLGFGMTENAKYFIEGALASGGIAGVLSWVQLVVTRTLFSALMHATATSIVGALLGLGKFKGWGMRSMLAALGMAIAIVIHGIWNGVLVTEWNPSPGSDWFRWAEKLGVEGDTMPFFLDAGIFIVELVLALAIFFCCIAVERRNLQKTLQSEAEQGILPKEHVPILTSFTLRRRSDWLDARIPKDAYIQTATTLGLRKSQLQLVSGKRRKWYESDYRRLQEELKHLLELAPKDTLE